MFLIVKKAILFADLIRGAYRRQGRSIADLTVKCLRSSDDHRPTSGISINQTFVALNRGI
jgi:hypothetical protein